MEACNTTAITTAAAGTSQEYHHGCIPENRVGSFDMSSSIFTPFFSSSSPLVAEKLQYHLSPLNPLTAGSIWDFLAPDTLTAKCNNFGHTGPIWLKFEPEVNMTMFYDTFVATMLR